jgi:hypothetical protein
MKQEEALMALPIPEGQFVKFLCSAKRATYAAQDESSRVNPVLSGSRQLEYRVGALLYRDIYFGGDYFVGQETIYHKSDPIWGMSYAGGINEGVNSSDAPGIYDFLKTALRCVPENSPFRGPESFIEGNFIYSNRILGYVARFSGSETILYQELPIYQLHYSGGIFR